jgi:hypothetical protein
MAGMFVWSNESCLLAKSSYRMDTLFSEVPRCRHDRPMVVLLPFFGKKIERTQPDDSRSGEAPAL